MCLDPSVFTPDHRGENASLWLSFNSSLNPNPSWALADGARETLNRWCCWLLFAKLASGHPEMHPQPRPGCSVGEMNSWVSWQMPRPMENSYHSSVYSALKLVYRTLSEPLAVWTDIYGGSPRACRCLHHLFAPSSFGLHFILSPAVTAEETESLETEGNMHTTAYLKSYRN